jgi:hypothetical protein
MIRPHCVATVFALLLTHVLHAPARPAAAAEGARALAVVTEVTGKASTERGPLLRLARLAAGDVVRTEPGASLQLAFASGRRYRLGGKSSVTVGEGDVTHPSGQVQPLARLPRFPLVPEIVDDPGLRIGGGQIRGNEITGLFPRCTTVPAAEIRLTWDPLPHAGAYRVEVRDFQGNVVDHAEGLTVPAAVVPAGKLAPGRPYSFEVQTTDQPGSQATGRAHFAILPADTTAAWHELREALAKEGDAGAWALLAAVDRQLKLRGEERADLGEALKRAPDDPGLVVARDELERMLNPRPAP